MPPAVTVTAPALDLTTMPARELAALVRVGRLSAQDLLVPLLRRVAAHVPALADTRHATAQAVRLDALREHGVAGGPLAGVPVLVGADLAVVRRLRSAGAVALPGDPDVLDGPAPAAAAVADRVVPLAVVAGDPAVHAAAAARGLVALDLDVDGERVGVLARDVRDAGLVLGVLAASYGPDVVLTLPTGTTPAQRVEAESRLRTTVARLQLA